MYRFFGANHIRFICKNIFLSQIPERQSLHCNPLHKLVYHNGIFIPAQLVNILTIQELLNNFTYSLHLSLFHILLLQLFSQPETRRTQYKFPDHTHAPDHSIFSCNLHPRNGGRLLFSCMFLDSPCYRIESFFL